MDISLTLRTKIYLLSLIAGLFLIGLVANAYYNLNHFSERFESFSKTNTFAKKSIHLAKDVEKLRNSVQRFIYTGLKEEAIEANKLYIKINKNIDENSPSSKLRVTENFILMKRHLEKYMATFKELEKQIASRKQLSIDKKRLSQKIEEKIQSYFASSSGEHKDRLHLQLLNSLHRAEKSTLYFFESLDNSYIKISKKELKYSIAIVDGLTQEESYPAKQKELGIIVDKLVSYTKINTKEIQHTRGYLFLVNVVMAAEAYEVLYQANLISDTSQKILDKIDKDINKQISNLINTLGITGALSLLVMITLSLLVTRSIVDPIAQLTRSFTELSKGNSEALIPQYNVDDEIGDLTKAARKFRYKNEEIEELLEHAKELSEELSLSEERFSLALEGAKDGLWDWNLITDEVFYSDTWKQMFGYETDEVSDNLQEWKDKIHPDDLQDVMQDLTEYLQGKSPVYESEMRILCKDGTYKHILARGKSISDENAYMTRMIGLHMDISEQKNLENSLIKAKIEADNANKAKSDFLANMSHEIRTPLNGILGLTDLVLKTRLDEKQKEYLKKSKTSSQALLRVINDILDYSKIEAGKLDLETNAFDLDDMLENLKDLFDYQAHEKGVGLEFSTNTIPPNTKLIGDALRLTQILTNLIGNALKFTDKGSVNVTVSSLQEDDLFHDLRFCVKDSGIGISQSVQEHLFKEFSQADTSITRQYGGTGLGLAISKQLVHMMEGNIWVESTLGEGSAFIFDVRFEKPQKKSSHKLSITPAEISPTNLDALQGVKILLVEDNKVNQIVAMGILEDYLVHIDVANNGQEAVDMVSKKQYDIILMDLQMPVMDGFEATRLIREMDHYKHTPIFALSAAVMQQDKELTQKAGMNEHLAKPIDKEALLQALIAYT